MNKTLKTIGLILLGIVAISLFFYNIHQGIIREGIKSLIKDLAIVSIIIVISWIFFFKVQREKAVKLIQYIGFSCFFLWLAMPSILISNFLFTTGAVSIVMSIMLKRDLKPKEGGSTLDEQIKNQLKINAVSKKMNLPSKIGGFVVPALPFFHITSKRWKGDLGKEATIHENVHLYYLQNGWLLGMIIIIALVASQVQKLMLKTFDISLFVLFMVILSFVVFEQVTFNKTYKIGQEMGIVTREWNWRIGLKYSWMYTLQFLAVFFIFQAFKFMFVLIKAIF